MKVELKNIKIAEFASHETTCYEATVYVDGVRAFTASNDGNGGTDFYYPFPGKRDLMNAAEDWAKTLPAIECYGTKLDSDLELVIGDLLNEEMLRRDRKSAAAKGIAFHPDGDKGKIATFPFRGKLTAAQREKARARWIPELQVKHPDAIFFDGQGRYIK